MYTMYAIIMVKAVVAITGASGAQYAVRLVNALLDANWEIDLIVTNAGAINLKLECSITPEELANDEMVRKVYLGQNFELRKKKIRD